MANLDKLNKNHESVLLLSILVIIGGRLRFLAILDGFTKPVDSASVGFRR